MVPRHRVGFAWVAMTGSTPSKVDVYLDGEFQTTIDLYSSPAVYNVLVWSCTNRYGLVCCI